MTICILLLIVINPTASKQLQESMFVSGKETDASGGSYVKFSKQLEKEKTMVKAAQEHQVWFKHVLTGDINTGEKL